MSSGDGDDYYHFTISEGKRVAASGNIQTLMKADGSLLDLSGVEGCYKYMFEDCTSLTRAPSLPALSLSFDCYTGMFSGCTSLSAAPNLPATKLGVACYHDMFLDCSSIVQVQQALPATTLSADCYRSMFSGCSSLAKAPDLPATELAEYCYHGMFARCGRLSSMNVSFSAWQPASSTNAWVRGVAQTGVFNCPQALPETHGVHYIPDGWSVQR